MSRLSTSLALPFLCELMAMSACGNSMFNRLGSRIIRADEDDLNDNSKGGS